MPLLDHETILRSRIPSITLPSWWRQKVSKYSSKNNSDIDDITGNAGITARDWRSLSPNNPPLPFVLDNDDGGMISDIYPHITQASERAPKRLPIPKKYRHSSYDDDQLQKLSTIIEESDLLTEISLSPKNSSNYHRQQRHQQEEREYGLAANTLLSPSQHNHDKNDDITIIPSPLLPPNDSPHPPSTRSTSPALPTNDTMFSSIESTNNSFIESSSLTLPPFSNDSSHQPTTEITSSSASIDSSSSLSSSSLSSSSTPSFPTIWPIHAIKSKGDNSPISTKAELNAKLEFIHMIQMTYKFRQDNQFNMPSKMEILFDSQDNVHKLQLWVHDKIQYHVFQGDAQYLPPELPTRRTYDCDSMDVWILGISLYRMLVGKYPFQANNDRRLFSKMQHADFGIPSHLSTDAKDLLRRMLAPDHSRASLDLVMYHPWLKPYSALPYYRKDQVEQSPPLLKPASVSSTRAIPRDLHSSGSSPPPRATSANHYASPNVSKRKKSIVSKLKKAFVFIVQGPCPPPTHPYRDLSPTKYC